MLAELFVLFLYCVMAVAGGWAGIKLARTPRRFWLILLGICFCIFLIITLVRHVPAICYHPDLLILGQSQFTEILFCGVVPLLFGILVPQLQQKRIQILVFVFAAAATFYFGFFTQLGFVIARNHLASLKTWREDNICLQTTNYTCGAAAAVSALNILGISADESALAIASRSSPISGTTEYMLARGIENLYANEKISCQIRGFNNVDQLHGQCPVIALVKLRLGVDHFVAVLDIDKDTLTIAGPLSGKEVLTHDVFAEKWRFTEILIQKKF